MLRHRGYYEKLGESFNDQMHCSRHIIINDIKRTYAAVITERTRGQMLRVLFSYAKRNMEVGYCQGMNFICYYLLKVGFEEEEVFWLLVHIFEQLVPKSYYTSMVSIIADIKMLKQVLKQNNPKLVQHIQDLNADLGFLLIPWFVTAFTNVENETVRLSAKNGNYGPAV